MLPVTIARESRAANDRETLVYRQLETALGSRGSVVGKDLHSLVGHRDSAFGLERIRPLERLVAFGRTAHIGLADFEKRTLFATDLALDSEPVDIARLMWSSLNTTHAIALGRDAWVSMQRLPIAAIRVHPTPPLRMETTPDPTKSSVRIVAHGRQPQTAAAAALLRRAGFAVTADQRWCDEAAIHLHIGPHDRDASEPRLVDSWASGRLAIQIDGGEDDATPTQPQTLRIDHERNGLVCRTVGDVAAMCEEVRADATFWGKLVKAGHNAVAPLSRGWVEIADEILA